MPGLVIYNAASGSAEDIPPERLLEVLPPGAKLHPFREDDCAATLARDAVAEGRPWIAVAGGDGTVEAAATSLIHTGVPLSVIPCGTYNNFARSLGVPSDPLEAAGLVRDGRTRRIDVGMLNGRPFFEAAGAGLDAALFPLGEEIKGGAGLRWFELLRRAWHYPRQTFQIEIDRPLRDALGASPHVPRRWRRFSADRRHLRVRALMITVSNGPYYGMNFTVAPEARLDNGTFIVTIYHRYSKWELARHFFSIRAGRRNFAPRGITLRVARLRVSARRRLPAHADGNPVDVWPLDLEVLPAALTVFARQ